MVSGLSLGIATLPYSSEEAPCVSAPGINSLFMLIVDQELTPWPWVLAVTCMVFLHRLSMLSFWGQGRVRPQPHQVFCQLVTQNKLKGCFSSPFKHWVLKPSGGFPKAKGFQSLGFSKPSSAPCAGSQLGFWRDWLFSRSRKAPLLPQQVIASWLHFRSICLPACPVG